MSGSHFVEEEIRSKPDAQTHRMQLRFRGKLLQPETSPQYPKPFEVIRINAISNAKDFGLLERKVWNYLFAYAYESGLEETDRQVHTIQIQQISAATGINHHKSIRRAIKNLQKILVKYDRLDRNSRVLIGEQHLFSSEIDIDDRNPVLSFEIPFGVRALMRKPSVYAYLDIGTIFRFQSKYSIALYELLSLLVKRSKKEQSYAVEDLVDFLCWPRNADGSFDFKNFRVRALEKAISEINEHASFHIPTPVFVKDEADSRRIAHILFRIVNKDSLEDTVTPDTKRSGLPNTIPHELSILRPIAKKEVEAAWWHSFCVSRIKAGRPADLASAWESWVDAMKLSTRLKDKFQVSDETVSAMIKEVATGENPSLQFEEEDVVDRFSKRSGKAVKSGFYNTARSLLQVWRLRCEESERRDEAGIATPEDCMILLGCARSNERRDAMFQYVIRRERNAGWPGIPTRDMRAPEKIWAFRQATKKHVQTDVFSRVPPEQIIESEDFQRNMPSSKPARMDDLIEYIEQHIPDHGMDLMEDYGYVAEKLVYDHKRRIADIQRRIAEIAPGKEVSLLSPPESKPEPKDYAEQVDSEIAAMAVQEDTEMASMDLDIAGMMMAEDIPDPTEADDLDDDDIDY